MKKIGDFNNTNTAVQSITENLTTVAKTKLGVSNKGLRGQDFAAALEDTSKRKAIMESILMAGKDMKAIMEGDQSGIIASDWNKLMQLGENSANAICNENATLGAVNPQVALTMPLMYVNWMKNTMKNVISTEVPDSTEIVKQIKRKYIKDNEGNRFELPFVAQDREKMRQIKNTAKRPVQEEHTLPVQNLDLITPAGGFIGKDSLSIEFYVTQVEVTKGGTTKYVAASKRITRSSRGLVEVKVYLGTELAGVVFVKVDFKTGKFTATPTAEAGFTLNKIKIKGYVSAESNLHTLAVDWDTEDWTLTIPEGRHFNTNVSHESMTDISLFYNVDQTKEVTDQMLDAIELLKDDDILEYVDDRYDEISEDPHAGPYIEFSLAVGGNYALDPVTWRSIMLKDIISRMAREMKKPLYSVGNFSIAGNSSVVGLLQNVEWVWTEGTDKAGVATPDAMGIYDQDGHVFKVVSSDRIPDNKLRIYFNPTEENKMTYKFYQHSTYISNKYNNPAGNVALPNIMVTDRYIAAHLWNVQGQVQINGVSSIFKKAPIVELA